MLTVEDYSSDEDHEAACTNEFGETAVVADWVFDIRAIGEGNWKNTMKALGIPISHRENHYFVTRERKKIYSGSRVYFFENHDNKPPKGWLAHDQYAGVSLGSWYDISGKVLCVR